VYYAEASYHFAEVISHPFLFKSFSLHGINGWSIWILRKWVPYLYMS